MSKEELKRLIEDVHRQSGKPVLMTENIYKLIYEGDNRHRTKRHKRKRDNKV